MNKQHPTAAQSRDCEPPRRSSPPNLSLATASSHRPCSPSAEHVAAAEAAATPAGMALDDVGDPSGAGMAFDEDGDSISRVKLWLRESR